MAKMTTRASITITFFIFINVQVIAQPDTLHNAPRHQDRKWIRSLIAPAALFASAGLTSFHNHVFDRYDVKNFRNEHAGHFRTHLDDALVLSPIAAVYGLNLIGVKGKNRFTERTVLLIKSELLVAAIVYPLKTIVHENRPDGSNLHSFPSGHTSNAFAAAAFMAKEYRDKSVWYPIAAYAVATTVGTLRVMNDKHWMSDVLAGAGVGILSTNLVYLTHQYRWSSRIRINLAGSISNRNGAFYLSYRMP
jgi:membrane-associated phospholipid phosphatase